MTPGQCRAARALLDWTLFDLAEQAGLSSSSLRSFEKGRSKPTDETMRKLKSAFEAAGIEFLNGGAPGVRVKATA